MSRLKHLVFLFFIVQIINAQSEQGFIVYDSVAKTLPEYKTQQIALKKLTKVYTDSINSIASKFQKRISHRKLDSADIKSRSIEIYKIESKIRNYQKYALDIISKEESKNAEALKEIIKDQLYKFCKINNLATIVDKKLILYCSNCADYTNVFINFLKINRQ